jgi:hypothetical protein
VAEGLNAGPWSGPGARTRASRPPRPGDPSCREARAAGNLVQDAWFAALAIESGCEWITTDRDYARFAGLKWRAPW